MAQASQSIACIVRVAEIAGKYDQWLGEGVNAFLHTDEFMKRLNAISDKLDTGESIALCIYLNDEYTLTFDSDIKGLNQAIVDYPKNGHEGPKKILVKMRELLIKHKTLKISYDGVTMSSVTSGNTTTVTL